VRVEISSHLFADVALQRRFAAEWSEILGHLTGLPGGSAAIGRAALMEVRAQISAGLSRFGWERDVSVLVDRAGRPIETPLRADFAKKGVVVEAGFGLRDSLYHDLFVIQVAGAGRAADIGVLVLPSMELVGSSPGNDNHATYEQALELQRYRYALGATPFAIVGLTP